MIRLLFDTKEIGRERWQQLLKSSSVRSFFQSPAAHEFFSQCGEFDSVAIGVESGDILQGVIVISLYKEGGALKRCFTSRGVINGGPLLSNEISDEELSFLLKGVKQHFRRKCIYLETRNFNDYSRWRAVFEQEGFSYQPHYNYHIDTSNMEKVMSNMNRSRRREIHRALLNGAIVEENKEYIEFFYDHLSELYKTKVRKPLSSRRFFEQLVAQTFTRLFVAKTPDNEIISGILTVELPEDVMYGWYGYGQKRINEKFHPSTMKIYAALQYAAEHGFQRFDMMGAGSPGDGGYGVRDFKAQFGGTLVEHGRFLHVYNRPVYALGKLYIKLKSKR
jgi:lipid II:glycine glycyltransferase (peptidoglycan interpeptide bridge formation enzyme)